MTEDQRIYSHAIIHTGSALSGLCGFLPIVEELPVIIIQGGMIIALGCGVYQVPIGKLLEKLGFAAGAGAHVLKLGKNAILKGLGAEAKKVIEIKFFQVGADLISLPASIPTAGIANVINSFLSLLGTEAIGWIVVNALENETAKA